MKRYIKNIPNFIFQLSFFNCMLCFMLSGCIEEYVPTRFYEIENILAVDGIITDDETYITLSRSTYLTADSYFWEDYITDAKVFVECDDDTFFSSQIVYNNRGWYSLPQYLIKTGKLDVNKRYRLLIETANFKYRSEYLYPVITPEIDSIFWIKNGRGQPVMIYIATQSPEENILHYRWAIEEDWEVRSFVYHPDYNYYCWNSNYSGLNIGSAEKRVLGKLTEKILEIHPSNNRLSVMYRINVKQNAISKKAYDYFSNIKKNSTNLGGIFAPIPSEMRGNIICVDDPEKHVIGYIDISTTSQMQHIITRSHNLYERPWVDCEISEDDDDISLVCVECTHQGGTLIIPDNWPPE